MVFSNLKFGLAFVLAATISVTSHAESLYGSVMIGTSSQETDSEAYGNNIAVDPDFPGKFSTGDGTVGTLGLGYSFSGPLRIEGRLGFHEADFNSQKFGTGARAGEEYVLNGDIQSTTLTVEGFYDIPVSSSIKSYVKAGVGVARNRYSARLGGAGVAAFDPFDGTTDGFYDNYADEKSTEFTWNVGVGGIYAINNQISLVGEYQYVSLGDASTGQDSFSDGFRVEDATANEFHLGVQVNF